MLTNEYKCIIIFLSKDKFSFRGEKMTAYQRLKTKREECLKEIERLEKEYYAADAASDDLLHDNSARNKAFDMGIEKMKEAIPLLKTTYICKVLFEIFGTIALTVLFVKYYTSYDVYIDEYNKGYLAAWLVGVFLFGITMMHLTGFIPESIQKKYGLISSRESSFWDKVKSFFMIMFIWILVSIPGLQSIMGFLMLADPDHTEAKKTIEEKERDYRNAKSSMINLYMNEMKTAKSQLDRLKAQCPSIREVNEAKDISPVKVGVTITWAKSGKQSKVTDIKWDSGRMVYSLEFQDGTTGICLKGNLYDDCLCDDTGKIIIK